MEISLIDFFYYFDLTKSQGGLHIMDMKFKPCSGTKKNFDDMKATARRCIDAYTGMLDPIYDGILDGKKEPRLTDTPHSISSGYRYKGRFIEGNLDTLETRLQEMFGKEAVDMRGDFSPHLQQDVTVSCSFQKGGGSLDDIEVIVKFNMSHVLNVCFLRFTQKLEGLRIEPDPGARIGQLEQMLENTVEREDKDYYEMLMDKAGSD